METFSSIECFVRSAEVGSFAEAARRLSLTPAAVGKSVAKLEARLGVRLFQRSTRSLTLTEAGQLFLGEVSTSLHTIQNAVANLASAEGRPAGTLKVSMGTVFGRLYIVPLLGEFLQRFPAINPDWHFDNRQVDFDRAGVRRGHRRWFRIAPRCGGAQIDTGAPGIGGVSRVSGGAARHRRA